MLVHHVLRGVVVAVSLSFVVACGGPEETGDPLSPRAPDDDAPLPAPPLPAAPQPNDLADDDDRRAARRGAGVDLDDGDNVPPDDSTDDESGADEDGVDDEPEGGDAVDDTGTDADTGADDEDADAPLVPDPVGRVDPDEIPAAPPIPADPTAPLAGDGTELPWPAAPQLSGVVVRKNRDSVSLSLPPIAGAADYRAFVLSDDVTLALDEDGNERVLGATVHCAGHEQRNAPAGSERVPVRSLEVTGVTGAVRIVVEALDTACPFAGVIGDEHEDIAVTNGALAQAERVPFAIFSEDEVRERYGSLILNGHRKGSPLGAPASDLLPGVLARTTVTTGPKAGAPPVSDFFSGFSDNDPPSYVGELPSLGRAPHPGRLYENDQFTFTSYGMETEQIFVDRGQLHMLLADWEQDVFATSVAYPKRAASMRDDAYVHVTFEVPSNATQRRYWWLSLCGAGAMGQTIGADGRLLGNIIQTPFFYQNDGKNPSVEKWSCLQLFPRDGLPNALPPTGERPQSDLRVMVNVAAAGERDSVRNVSPAQYPSTHSARSWYRQMNASGELTEPMLDDQLLVTQRTRYDVYVRNDRVIVYVNGEQRLCNDFPGTPLTMAEAAVGFGQVLYHSAAERVEFGREFNDRTGQRYYLENTPYLDARAWDNVGFDEGAAAPASFDESVCYLHQG